jgi:hypothetical protein
MMKIGLHYSNTGDRLVEIKRINPDNTYATVFHNVGAGACGFLHDRDRGYQFPRGRIQ